MPYCDQFSITNSPYISIRKSQLRYFIHDSILPATLVIDAIREDNVCFLIE
eukprot:GAHX01001982.1.p1 GENE.GAHX01001982.1~~GAHX01001982.1.p1  ORF type:complete len:51 (+),score=0.80 GAHX01001982.1:327-479(+)